MMTRTSLLATTAAMLLPLTGALAQSEDTDTYATGGGAAATSEMQAQGDAAGENLEDATESATSAAKEALEEAGETAEQVGEAATETTEKAVEGAEGAMESAAGTLSPEVDVIADTEAVTGPKTVGDAKGMTVVDTTGAEVGEVDMVVEEVDGAAAVIGVGGFLGFGEHHVAVPASDLTVSPDGKLKLGAYTEEDLRQLPAFEEGTAPVLADESAFPELG